MFCGPSFGPFWAILADFFKFELLNFKVLNIGGLKCTNFSFAKAQIEFLTQNYA